MTKKEHVDLTHAGNETKKSMPMWAKIALWVTWFIVALVSLLVRATSGISWVADNFFGAMQEWNVQEAYNMTASEFQQSTDYKAFEEYVKNNYLGDYKSSIRTTKEVENNKWYLKGTIKTTKWVDLSMEVMLIKKEWEWKIYWLNIAPTWTESRDQLNQNVQQNTDITMPSKQEAVALIQTSLWTFSDAVIKADFTEFYSSISDIWKKETTATQLWDIFKSFVEKKVDLSFVKKDIPTIEKEPTLQNDSLYMEGYYTLSDWVKVNFKLGYYMESWSWKLVWININIG